MQSNKALHFPFFPSSPVSPLRPVGPCTPLGPGGPFAPSIPGVPWGPVGPCGPLRPGSLDLYSIFPSRSASELLRVCSISALESLTIFFSPAIVSRCLRIVSRVFLRSVIIFFIFSAFHFIMCRTSPWNCSSPRRLAISDPIDMSGLIPSVPGVAAASPCRCTPPRGAGPLVSWLQSCELPPAPVARCCTRNNALRLAASLFPTESQNEDRLPACPPPLCSIRHSLRALAGPLSLPLEFSSRRDSIEFSAPSTACFFPPALPWYSEVAASGVFARTRRAEC
mmetsp:Transcript_5510/g.12714  ORF Transcript_5510/g.12714 Transcript_5510/m.12714 type:complete len:281 (-) Transcript_5510:148-990(-)